MTVSGRRPRYALGWAMVGFACLVALPDGASAATVAVVVKRVSLGEGATELDQRLVLRAKPGERNRIRLVFAGRSVTIRDRAGVEPLRGCRRILGIGTAARCELRAIYARAVVSLRDGNDVVRLAGFVVGQTFRGRLRRRPVGGEFHAGSGDDIVIGGDGFGEGPPNNSGQELNGGPGDDLLVGGRQSGRFRGGPGRDRMVGGPDPDYFYEDKRKNGGDTIVGGRPSVLSEPSDAGDEAWYSERQRQVVADLDDRPDDGEHGEHDRLVGIEGIQGGSSSDRLSGDRGQNALTGGRGADQLAGGLGADSLNGDAGPDELIGGPGADFIDAGPGDDSVLADDGIQDDVACGFGMDRVLLDGLDFFLNEENYLGERDLACEQVSRSGPVGLLFLGEVELRHLRSGAVETFYVVGCPGDALHCDGRLTLLRGDQILFTDPISLDSSTRESVFGSIPKELASSVPKTGFPGTVLVTFVDPSGATVERRTAVTVRVF
jgi:hypothetical protein